MKRRKSVTYVDAAELLTKTNRYLNQCRPGMDPAAWQKQVDGQYEHYLAVLGTVQLPDGDAASALATAINNGVWSAAQKTELNKAVAAKLAADQHVETRKSTNRPSQSIPLFKNYLSVQDVQCLQGQHDDLVKIGKIAARMALLKMDIPHEYEWRRIIQQCQAFGLMEGKTDNAVYFKHMVDSLKAAVRQRFRNKAKDWTHIETYPEGPEGLPDYPEGLYKAAYSEADPPSPAAMSHSSPMPGSAVDNPLRKTARSLRQAETQALSPVMQNPFMNYQALAAAAAQHLQQQGQQFRPRNTGNIDITLLGNKATNAGASTVADMMPMMMAGMMAGMAPGMACMFPGMAGMASGSRGMHFGGWPPGGERGDQDSQEGDQDSPPTQTHCSC